MTLRVSCVLTYALTRLYSFLMMVVRATLMTKGASNAVPKRSTAGSISARIEKLVDVLSELLSCTSIVRKKDPMS